MNTCLVTGGLHHVADHRNQVLPLDELELDQHALAASSPGTPEAKKSKNLETDPEIPD